MMAMIGAGKLCCISLFSRLCAALFAFAVNESGHDDKTKKNRG